jgi:hypothetical protein
LRALTGEIHRCTAKVQWSTRRPSSRLFVGGNAVDVLRRRDRKAPFKAHPNKLVLIEELP